MSARAVLAPRDLGRARLRGRRHDLLREREVARPRPRDDRVHDLSALRRASGRGAARRGADDAGERGRSSDPRRLGPHRPGEGRRGAGPGGDSGSALSRRLSPRWPGRSPSSSSSPPSRRSTRSAPRRSGSRWLQPCSGRRHGPGASSRPFREQGRAGLWRLGALGALSAASSILFVAGVQYAGVAVATVLSSTAPIFALPLGFFFLGERVAPSPSPASS